MKVILYVTDDKMCGQINSPNSRIHMREIFPFIGNQHSFATSGHQVLAAETHNAFSIKHN